MQRLFEKAYWTYDHGNDNSVDTYDFPTFWSQTSTPTILHKASKKHIIDTISILDNTTTIGNVSEPNDNSHDIPSPRAVSASIGTIQTSLFPAAVSASVDIPQDIPHAEAVSAFEGAVHNMLNTRTVSASVDIPQDIPPAEAVSACEGAVHHTLTTGIVSVPEDESLPMNRVADVLIHEGAANGTIPLGATSGHKGVSPALLFTPVAEPHSFQTPKAHSQYTAYLGSSDFCAYKQQKGINGHIYIQKDVRAMDMNHIPVRSDKDVAPSRDYPHIFSAFCDLPVLYTEASIQCFLVMNNKEDTLTQSQMLKTPDRDSFIAAQIPEIRGLEKLQVFQYQNIRDLPPNAKLFSSIWSYRNKRYPTGELVKHKARICVDGSQQKHGRDYWETNAPVVSWSTVRLILLLSTILNLKSRQVDYTQAFPQAELHNPVFMQLPQGWHLDTTRQLQPHPGPKYNDTSHFVRFRRNLYGCKLAARNWFQHLNQGLLSQGFTQSKNDPCLYLRADCIMVVYTDDCLIFAKDNSTIDDLIMHLSETFHLEDQGTVHDYLGIRIQTDSSTESISMTQTGLIESIILDVGLSFGFTRQRSLPYWIHYYLLRLSYSLGQQTPNGNCSQYN